MEIGYDEILKGATATLGEKKLVLTETEAATLLGMTPASIRMARFRRSGCPFIKNGSSVRYLLPDIVSYLMENRVDTKKGGESD